MLSRSYIILHAPLSQIFSTCPVQFSSIRKMGGDSILALNPLIYAGLKTGEKAAFEGKECVKKVELHSSFIVLADPSQLKLVV